MGKSGRNAGKTGENTIKMKALDLIRKQTEEAHTELAASLQGVSNTVANSGSSATRNSIAAIYAHALLSADIFFNVAINGGAPVLFSSGSADKLGIADPNPRNWDALRAATFKTADLSAYGAAVLTSIQTTLAGLTEAGLARKFEFFGEQTTVVDTIALAISHATTHNGEIAALKGVSGLKGLPY
jgi:uncharacterized damage-inducible protein DinB